MSYSYLGLTEELASKAQHVLSFQASSAASSAVVRNTGVIRKGSAQGAAVTSAVASRPTFSRASVATYFDASGTLQTAAVNVERTNAYTWNGTAFVGPATLLEGASSNSVANARFEGAVVGTPGTLPAGYQTAFLPTNLNTEVVGFGTIGSLPYFDLRFFGTSVSSGRIFIYPSEVPATPGQTWSLSLYWAISAGTTAGMTAGTADLSATCIDNNFTNLGTLFQTTVADPAAAPIATQFKTGGGGPTPATTAFLQPLFTVDVTGGTVDITYRFAGFQLEPAATPSSLILPPVGSPGISFRAADILAPPGSLTLLASASATAALTSVLDAARSLQAAAASIAGLRRVMSRRLPAISAASALARLRYSGHRTVTASGAALATVKFLKAFSVIFIASSAPFAFVDLENALSLLLHATAGSAAALRRGVSRTSSGIAATTTGLQRLTSRLSFAANTPAATMHRASAKQLTALGHATVVLTTIRASAKQFTASGHATVVLTTIRARLVTVLAAAASTGTLRRGTSKTAVVVITTSATVTRLIGRSVIAAAATIATVRRRSSRIVAATTAPTAAVGLMALRLRTISAASAARGVVTRATGLIRPVAVGASAANTKIRGAVLAAVARGGAVLTIAQPLRNLVLAAQASAIATWINNTSGVRRLPPKIRTLTAYLVDRALRVPNPGRTARAVLNRTLKAPPE
ncbi:hypothetical protein [Rhodopila sp.]|uniref:hypothetical protein n=1 Tax=Rhodopila sp. TaxID=2480087 RepID=UPI003D11424E